jgi:hypothetical protein
MATLNKVESISVINRSGGNIVLPLFDKNRQRIGENVVLVPGKEEILDSLLLDRYAEDAGIKKKLMQGPYGTGGIEITGFNGRLCDHEEGLSYLYKDIPPLSVRVK